MEQNMGQAADQGASQGPRADSIQADPSLLNGVQDPVILTSGTEMAVEPVRARPYDPNSFCDDYLRGGTCHGY